MRLAHIEIDGIDMIGNFLNIKLNRILDPVLFMSSISGFPPIIIKIFFAIMLDYPFHLGFIQGIFTFQMIVR